MRYAIALEQAGCVVRDRYHRAARFYQETL